jgi:Ca2+-binding RTX toxin-like protein
MRTRLARLGLALAIVPVTVVLGGADASAGRSCDGQAVTILGTRGDDDLRGTAGGDVILGLGGNDVIRGAGGGDVLCGSSGNDRLLGGGGGDVVVGDEGKDELDGGGGIDTVSYARSPNGVRVDLSAGTVRGWGKDTVAEIENIVGSNDDDDLTAGRREASTIAGRDGDDVLTGSGASDILDGGNGDDRIDGGPGQANVVTYAGAPQGVEVDLTAGTATGWGTDTVSGIQFVIGSDFGDTLTGNTQRNTFSPGGGDDTIVGIGSGDTVDLTSASAGVVVDLAAGTATGNGVDTLSGIGSVDGSAFDDTITGDQRRNTLNGAAGDDTILGNEGPDTLDGGEGVDSLDGGQGDDSCLNGETLLDCEA